MEGAESPHEQEHRIGRELLRRGLRELYEMEAVDIDAMLDTEENGKPFLRDHPEIHFNISHCNGLVACAFADGPVGVDVEKIRPVRAPLIRRVLHEKEQQCLWRYGTAEEADHRRSSPEFLRLFFRYWTLKESYLKRDGSGLTRELREICFFVDPEDWNSPVYVSNQENSRSPGVVCLQCCLPGPGKEQTEYILSMCVTKEGTGEKPAMEIHNIIL